MLVPYDIPISQSSLTLENQMVEDSEPVWPEMQRETGDRSQDRAMTDIGWEQEKLH